MESTQGINWQLPCNHKIVKSDLVYSPAQIIEHRRVELKDHDALEETKQWFEELKAKYPKVFSLNNEDIGHTQLVTMDIDTGDSPPVCQNHIPSPSNAILGFNRRLRPWNRLESSKRASVCGPVLLLLYLRNLHQVNPQGRECVLISES